MSPDTALAVLFAVLLPTPDELVGRLAASRAGITRFAVVVDGREADGFKHPSVTRVWQDGEKYREDYLSDFKDGKSARMISGTHCPERGMYFLVSYDRVFQPNRAAAMGPLADVKRNPDFHSFRVAALGTTPESIRSQALARDLKWYVGRPEWTDQRVELTTRDGLPAYKIVLTAPARGNARFEATLLPTRGYAVVSAVMTSEDQGKQSGEWCESELIKVGGYWLPKTCVHTGRDGDKVEKLTQRVQYLSINKEMDPKAFTLPGMDLIPGTLISTRDGVMKWDGKQLAPAELLRGP